MDDDSNVVVLRHVTSLDIPAERVLNGALEAGLKGVVVVGITQDGEEHIATSYGNLAETLWLLHRAASEVIKRGGGR